MGYFHYQGTTALGDEVIGTAKAATETDLALKLLQRGTVLENIRPALTPFDRLYLTLFRKQEITRITRQFALLLESKISIVDCLDLAHEGASDRRLQTILSVIKQQVESGKTVAEAFGGFPEVFDTLYINMLTAGELSGTLDQSFSRLADYREQSETALRKLRAALAYPLVVAGVSVAVVAVLVVFIVPIFAGMYANFGAELPAFTKDVVAISDIVRSYAVPGTFGLFVVIAGLISAFALPRVRLAWHRLLLQMPFVRTLVVKLVAMRFCRTLGSLLSSGVDIIVAVQVASKSTGNLFAQSLLMPVAGQLSGGQPLTESLAAANLLPKPAVRLIAAGEKTGQLGTALLRTADFYERETATAMATVVSLIEPVIIIALGILIAFLLVALYLPLFDLVGTVQ